MIIQQISDIESLTSVKANEDQFRASRRPGTVTFAEGERESEESERELTPIHEIYDFLLHFLGSTPDALDCQPSSPQFETI